MASSEDSPPPPSLSDSSSPPPESSPSPPPMTMTMTPPPQSSPPPSPSSPLTPPPSPPNPPSTTPTPPSSPPTPPSMPPPPSSSSGDSSPPSDKSSSSAPPPPPPSKSSSQSPPSSSSKSSPPSKSNYSPDGGNNELNVPPPPKLESSKRSPSKASSDQSPSDDSSSNKMPLIIGVAIGTGLLLLFLAVFFVIRNRKKRKSDNQGYYADQPHANQGGGPYNSSQNAHHQNNRQNDHVLNMPPPLGANHGGRPPPPHYSGGDNSSNFSDSHGPALPPPHPSMALGFNKSTFTYDELAAATSGFSQANLLGQGGFGYVHKGVLPNGKEIAVKSLKSGSGQGDREFQAEVDIISRVHHRHLVSLVGYCIAGGRKTLVYEFMPNNNLEYHLHDKSHSPLDWSSRLRIAIGSAKGLAYLHEDCHPRIIHRDIKTANILLDFNYEAKVADFGLAKLNQDNFTHVSTRVMGTFGYLAPEYASSGKLTEKSDVFSFGVVLLELITGRRPVDNTGDYAEDSLVDWARPLCARALEEGNFDELVDPRLENNFVPQEMARMVACAADSIRHSSRRRPKMSQIVRTLEGDTSLDDLNEGVKAGQNSHHSSSGSDYDAGLYSTDMKKFRKIALNSQDYGSSDYGNTSEYGLNPSTSSSEI